jgi:hypothetical protein
MNELIDLGPNTAHMNQRPSSPFVPGDRVIKKADEDPSVGVVIDVLPPEHEASIMGQTMEGEAVQVTFPSILDEGPGDWRTIHSAKLASYCHDQEIRCYTYKHTNLEFASNPFVAGDQVVKTSHDDPDVAVVIEQSNSEVHVAFEGQFDGETVSVEELQTYCDTNEVSLYSYEPDELAFAL